MSVMIRRNPLFPQMQGSWFGAHRVVIGTTAIYLLWIPGVILSVSWDDS